MTSLVKAFTTILLVIPLLLSACGSSTGNQPANQLWVPLGPLEGPMVGIIVVNPLHPDTLYSGEFMSKDGGNNWSRFTLGGTYASLMITLLPSCDQKILYAFTNEGFLKSTNGGQDWNKANNGLPKGSYSDTSIVVDPVVPSTVYMVMGGGIFKSTDAGETWTGEIWSSGKIYMHSIIIDPSNNQNIFAIATEGQSQGLPTDKVFKSSDGGQSWQAQDTQFTNARFIDEFLMLSPVSPLRLYAGGSFGLLFSDDQGKTWRKMGIPDLGAVNALAIDPTNFQILYVGTNRGVLKSTDGGQNLIPVNTGLNDQMVVQALAVNPTNPSIVYAGTYAGMFKSMDAGATWQSINKGFTGAEMKALAIDPINPNVMYVGANSGVFKCSDGGKTWQSANLGMGITNVSGLVMDPDDNHTLYAYTDLGFFKSIDSAQSWTAHTIGPKFGSNAVLAVDPSNGSVLFIGGSLFSGGLYKSTDGGESWSALGDVLKVRVSSIVFDPSDHQTMYIGSLDGKVHKSIDGGMTWQAVGKPSGFTDVTVLAVAPSNHQVVYGAGRNEVIKSTDGGQTWYSVSQDDKIKGTVKCLLVDPKNDKTVYAATWGYAILVSTDGAKSWKIAGGMNTSGVFFIMLDPVNNSTLYAGTVVGGCKLVR
jgi:photosystem II stability/assembly factor-like uncharacterized protein